MHTAEGSGPKWSLRKKKKINKTTKATIARYWKSAFAEHLNISSVAPSNDALYNAQDYKGLICPVTWQGQPCFTWWRCHRNTWVLQIWELLPQILGLYIPSNTRLTISESLSSPGFSGKDSLSTPRNGILSTRWWKAAPCPPRWVPPRGSVRCFSYSGSWSCLT